MQPLALALDRITLFVEPTPAHLIHQPERMARLGQAQIGVVFAQNQAVLCPAGEHAIGLMSALGDQVVNHDTEVSLIPTWPPGFEVARRARGVEPGKQPLCPCFLVSGGAVDLTGKIQALQAVDMQVGTEPARVEEVVLDGVAGTRDVR